MLGFLVGIIVGALTALYFADKAVMRAPKPKVARAQASAPLQSTTSSAAPPRVLPPSLQTSNCHSITDLSMYWIEFSLGVLWGELDP